ncbi:unnamed protein product, partial [Choristocarpus tenellus]
MRCVCPTMWKRLQGQISGVGVVGTSSIKLLDIYFMLKFLLLFSLHRCVSRLICHKVEFVEDCNSNESAHLFGNRASKASTYRGGWRSLKLSTQNQTRWEWPLRWFREPHVIEPSEQADSAPPHSQMVLAKAKKNDLKTGVMTRICFTYMASMAMKTAIPALLPTIAVDTVLMPQEGQLTLAIGLGTLGALVGKFLLGIT